MLSLIEQRAALMKSAKSKIDGAKSAGRDMSEAERFEVAGWLDQVGALDTQIKAAREGDALAERLGGARDGDGSTFGLKFLRTGPGARKTQAATIASQMARQGGVLGDPTDGVKSFLTGSGAVASQVVLSPDPVPLGKPVDGLLDVLPTQLRPAHYQYLRQVTRTNNAAIVAPGGLKPTSVYSIANVPNDLKVVAHLSEPVDIYLLADNDSLTRFLSSEMLLGIQRAIEAKVVADILGTSGIQATAFATDPVVTIRNAQTALSTAGFEAGVIGLNPTDWGAITSRRLTQTGAFDVAGGPVDLPTQRLWGTPVALSLAVTAGTALVLDPSAVAIGTDGRYDFRSDTSGDLFTHNQAVSRAETRTSTDVFQPLGVTLATLHA